MGTVRNWTPLDKFNDSIVLDNNIEAAGGLYLNLNLSLESDVTFEEYYNMWFNHEEVYKARRK